jgi:cytidine deaminase
MTPTSLSKQERALVLAQAREAVSRAYAPYSNFRVGAAVLTARGNIFTGVNVENASYGLTICAERAAVFHAVAGEGPEMRVKALAVVCEQPGPCPPCGACRQVLAEFGADAVIIFQGTDGLEEASLPQLLPHAFDLR